MSADAAAAPLRTLLTRPCDGVTDAMVSHTRLQKVLRSQLLRCVAPLWERSLSVTVLVMAEISQPSRSIVRAVQ